MDRRSLKNPGKVIGYARVSTHDQSLEGQIEALEKFGCDYIFREKASGAKMSRKALSEALNSVHPGDTFVVWKLDRLARSLKGLIEVTEYLEREKVQFVSLTDGIIADTASGKMMLHMLGAIAQFERDIISERTKMGMAAKKGQGVKPGQPHSIAENPKRLARWVDLRDSGRLGSMTARQITEELNKADPRAKKITSPQTYRNWKYAGFPGAPEEPDEPLDINKD